MLSSFFFLAAAEDGADAGKAIALALGIGLGALGAGVGIGNIFGSMIQAVARQPELRGELRASSGSASRSPRRSCSTASSAACSPTSSSERCRRSSSQHVLRGLIDVVPGLMIWTLICFAITFFVLRRFAFGPIQKTIDERRDRIRAAVDEADKARDEARELLEQHRQLIADAKGEAADILADARKVADAQIERVKEEAEVDRARRLEETKRQIDAETKRSLDMIRSEVADLTLEATARVTGKVLDAEDQRRLIDEAIAELDFSALEKERS